MLAIKGKMKKTGKTRKVAKSSMLKAAKITKAKTKIKKAAPSKIKSEKQKIVKVATTLKLAALKVVKPYTKSNLLSALAENTNLSKKDVTKVLEQLSVIIEGHLKKAGPGKFILPGLVKISVKDVAAKKARIGVHPLTRQQITFKAKPASRRIKITALKLLKTKVI